MNIEDTIQQLLNLYSSPDKWTQRTNARKRDGSLASPHSDSAYSFCLTGALCKLNKLHHMKPLAFYVLTIRPTNLSYYSLENPDLLLQNFNDSADFSQIISTLQQILQLAKIAPEE